MDISELSSRFAEKLDITRSEGRHMLGVLMEVMTEALIEGDEVRFPRIGKIFVREYSSKRLLKFKSFQTFNDLLKQTPVD